MQRELRSLLTMRPAIEYIAEHYQKIATRHILHNQDVLIDGGAGMFLEMGLGKTVSTLTALAELFRTRQIKRVLVIAPLRVAEHTWPEEINKWAHTRHLTYSVVTGDVKNRIKALRTKAQIYIINRENVPWLTGLLSGRKWPFDTVVIDELSSFKNPKSIRFKCLKVVRPQIQRMIGLTGTPQPNGLLDLWSQLYLLDRGKRLGDKIGGYRKTYFNEGQRKDHVVYNYNLKKEKNRRLGKDIYAAEIYDKISDICISMKAEDWLKLPKMLERQYTVDMHPALLEKYEEFEREAFLEYEDKELTAVNAASLTGKLLQFANGAIYTDSERRSYKVIHDTKLDVLEEIMEGANGKPVICFYRFRHDVERILASKKLKKYKPYKLGKSSKDIDKWNRGEIQLLLCHPKSAGHGLNMQDGGNQIVWFGLPWSLEDFQQANARLHRKGQKNRVIIHIINVNGTMDAEVAKSLLGKEKGQESLMHALSVKRRRYLAEAA